MIKYACIKRDRVCRGLKESPRRICIPVIIKVESFNEGGLADPLGLGVRIPWVLELRPFLMEMRPKGYLLFPIGKTNPHTPSEKFL